MSLTYFGLSLVLLSYLVVLLCAAGIWLILDSRALWRQFREQRAWIEKSGPSPFNPRQEMPAKHQRSGRARLRVVGFIEGSSMDHGMD